MRYSRQKELIKKIVKNTNKHPTAEDIYDKAREVEPNISLGTVYRDLKALADEGEIITLETVNKKVRYDGGLEPHVHAICENCGKILDIFVSVIPDEIEKEGFTVTGSKCVYYGICPECKNKLQAQANKEKGEKL